MWGQVEVVESYPTGNAGRAQPEKTMKTWGYELRYHNKNYCCKLLHFDQGSTSMHFHVIKHETLVVTAGVLTLDYIVDKTTHSIQLKQGEAWVVPPGHPHKLQALNGPVEVFEASTPDSTIDSIRIS